MKNGHTWPATYTHACIHLFGNIANIAYQLNRNLAWDPVKEKFNQDEEANQLLGRPMNNEWKIKL